MYLLQSKKTPLFAFIFRLVALAICLASLVIRIVANELVIERYHLNYLFAFFTFQTNIFTTIVFLILVIKSFIVLIKNKHFELVSIHSSVHLATIYYITITMVVFWLVLSSNLKGIGDPLSITGQLLVHLFVPLLAIIDGILFFNHGSVKMIDSLKWLIYPVLYLISVIIIAQFIKEPYSNMLIGDKVIALRYPYPFLDPQVVGIWGMVGIIAILFVIFYGFAAFYIFIDRVIAKSIKKRNNKNNKEIK